MTRPDLNVLSGDLSISVPSAGLREIPLEGGGHLRDLGGYPTRDNKVTKHGVAYRASSPAELTGADRRALRALGLAAHIDLRSSFELSALGPADFGDPRIRGFHVPLVEADDPARYAQRFWDGSAHPADPGATRAELYRRLLDDAGTALARAFVIAATDIPTVHHCSTGRDRTGLLSALLLRVADVPDSLIAWDYAMALPMSMAERARMRLMLSQVLSHPLSARSSWPPPGGLGEEILQALAHLDRRWDGVGPYLVAHGVKPDRIDSLAQIFTTQPAQQRAQPSRAVSPRLAASPRH